jgi:hypothetical protein
VIRRLFWIAVGACAGALAAVYTLAGIRRARTQLDPQTVPARVAHRAERAQHRVRHAVAEGRRVRTDYEDRARARAPRPTGPSR